MSIKIASSESYAGVNASYEGYEMGQYFTPTAGGNLEKISLHIKRVGTIGNYDLKFWSTVAGIPNVLLDTSTKDCSAIDTSSDWVEFDFSTPVSISAGTTYAITLECSGGDGLNCLFWSMYDITPTYYGRGRNIYNPGGGWVEPGNEFDFAFKVFVLGTEYENYEGNNSGSSGSYTGFQIAQTFKANVSQTLNIVRLLLRKYGTPGTLELEIQGVDGSLKPDGVALGTATIDGNGCTTWSSGQYEVFAFDPGISLTAGTTYAIVLKASGDISNRPAWIYDTNPGYTDGSFCYSNDGGSSWNFLGRDFLFSEGEISFNVPPSISVQPSSETYNLGDTAEFSITATGTPAPTYQWYKGVDALSGETSDTLSFTVEADSGGDYTCVVTNVEGSVTSDVATLSILPEITDQSLDTDIYLNQQVTLYVVASGYPAITYQWYKDGYVMEGETSSTLVFYASESSAGTYKCIVLNGVGSDTSADITLVVSSNPYTFNPFNLNLDQERG